MSDAIRNDRPAFPCLDSTESGLHLREPGLSMRDYFAAKAMQGFVAADKSNEIWRDWIDCGNDPTDDDSVVHAYATLSYGMADAMLKARESK